MTNLFYRLCRLVAVTLFSSLCLTGDIENNVIAITKTAVQQHGTLSITGSTIKDQSGNVVSYVQRVCNAPIIRIAMGAVADAAIAQGVYFIVDWHPHHAYTNVKETVEFFTLIAKQYVRTPNLIYEVYNEPLAKTD